jgi:pimeloyl-ACP methyl ester carboxylesterase
MTGERMRITKPLHVDDLGSGTPVVLLHGAPRQSTCDRSRSASRDDRRPGSGREDAGAADALSRRPQEPDLGRGREHLGESDRKGGARRGARESRRSADLHPAIAELDIPILLRAGALDMATPVANSTRIAAVAKCEVDIVPAAGHALLCEDFEETTAAIERHLARA